MAILVGDANVFIDVTVSNLSEAMFRLDDTIATPDVLYQDELLQHHPELPGLGLQINRLSSRGVDEVQRLRTLYKNPSTNDLFALALAKTKKWTLLSGDSDLRDAAVTEEVEVHGTIWLVERMVNSRVISSKRAEHAFRLMKENNRRLPWDAVDSLIVRLRD